MRFENRRIDFAQERSHHRRRVPGIDFFLKGSGHFQPSVGILDDSIYRVGQGRRIAGGVEKARFFMFDDFPDAPDIAGDHRHPPGGHAHQRFAAPVAEAGPVGEHDDVRIHQQFVDFGFGQGAGEKFDQFLDFEVLHQVPQALVHLILGPLERRAPSQTDQDPPLEGLAFVQEGDGAQELRNSLVGPDETEQRDVGVVHRLVRLEGLGGKGSHNHGGQTGHLAGELGVLLDEKSRPPPRRSHEHRSLLQKVPLQTFLAVDGKRPRDALDQPFDETGLGVFGGLPHPFGQVRRVVEGQADRQIGPQTRHFERRPVLALGAPVHLDLQDLIRMRHHRFERLFGHFTNQRNCVEMPVQAFRNPHVQQGGSTQVGVFLDCAQVTVPIVRQPRPVWVGGRQIENLGMPQCHGIISLRVATFTRFWNRPCSGTFCSGQ